MATVPVDTGLRGKTPEQKMVLVLDNTLYHHGWEEEVGVPKYNSKKYKVELLHIYGATSITVCRKGVAFNFDVPAKGSFPQANCKQGEGVSAEEVAAVTRVLFKDNHPKRLLERAEAFVQDIG